MPDASHVCAVDEEVWRQRHTAENVVLAGRREDLRLSLLGHDTLGLQHVQLDLALVPIE